VFVVLKDTLFRLSDIESEEVSLVDKGANKRRFLVVKRQLKQDQEEQPQQTLAPEPVPVNVVVEMGGIDTALSEISGTLQSLTKLEEVRTAVKELGAQVAQLASTVEELKASHKNVATQSAEGISKVSKIATAAASRVAKMEKRYAMAPLNNEGNDQEPAAPEGWAADMGRDPKKV